MPSYEVIKEVGDSLANIVTLEAKRQKLAIDVVLGPCDADFFARKKSSVAVYLYEFKFDQRIQQEAKEFEEEVDDPDGPINVQFPRPLVLELHYAVAATVASFLDETIALSVAVKGFYDHPTLNKELKLGKHFPEKDLPVDIDTAFNLERQSQLLHALGVKHHAMMGYKVVCEMKPERELRRTRRVERRTIDLYDKLKPPAGKGTDRNR